MTIALSLTILVLIGISVWQIAKIFELSQSKKENTQVANDNDNRYNGQLMFAFLLFIYGITLYSFWKWGDVLLPEAASEHGSEYDNLMWISFAIIFFVQTITQALLHYFSYKYHGKKGQKALFYADNDRLEAIWTIIPVITLAGLILYGLYTWTDIMSVEENEDALVVELYAQQFNWKARYAGDDGVLGDANVRFLQDFDGRNLVGIDATDPNGLDDVIVQELHLPVGREVIFKMRSQDVLHSAYMPFFRAHMRLDPDVVAKVKKINKIRAENSKALVANGEEALEPYVFDYLLLCNKICGASHYNMQMKIVVDTPEEFEKWMADQQTFAQVIQ
jgi:cytochrome c oxidase subunit 2